MASLSQKLPRSNRLTPSLNASASISTASSPWLDSSLQFLRDWLPLSRRPGDDKTGEKLRRWLDELNGTTPEVIASTLAKTMPKLIREEPKLPLRRMLLDALQAEAARIIPPLESAVDISSLPLRATAYRQALAADNLLKVIAEAYNQIVDDILEQQCPTSLAPLLQHAILGAMQALARRQVLAYRAYAPASESSWQQLHRLYRTARDRGLSDLGTGQERIATHYLAALLLAFADPSKFARCDIDRLAAVCRHLAPQLEVFDANDAASGKEGAAQFITRLGEGRPGRVNVRIDGRYHRSELIIDCSAAVAMLQNEIAAHTADTAKPFDTATPLAAASSLLPCLLDMWQGSSSRRFSRQNFRKRVDLVTGVDDLWRFLSGRAFQRRQEDQEDRETSELTSEWAVIDESPDGFGIRYIRGDLPAIEVGEIIGLRSRERSKVHVCLVRRITNLGASRLELGLQELSPEAQAISLPNHTNGSGKAILLPAMPCHGGAGGLIAAPGTMRRGAQLAHWNKESPAELRIGQKIESNQRCEIRLFQG